MHTRHGGGGKVIVPPLHKKIWKEFYLTEIFSIIQRGKRLKIVDHIEGDKPYISSTAENNGVDNFIGNEENACQIENCLTLANSGSVGKAFYHPYNFVASDHVTNLKDPSLNKYAYIFISSIISNTFPQKYGFNHEINSKRIKNEKIKLPVNENGEPDWTYMEDYIRQQENLLLQKYFDKKF